MSDCRCSGFGWYAEHREDCAPSDFSECCAYREAYCPCAEGDRLRECDGAAPREPKT